MLSKFCSINLYRFSLDFSKLSPRITTSGTKNYSIGQANIDGYITKNWEKAQHSVIMLHQWWGCNESITQTAQILSNNDIRVFVPDLYRGKTAINAESAGHHMNNLNWPGALNDIKTIKNHLDSRSKSVSIMGFCMGGALTFASLSSIEGWKAGIPFYGIPDLNIFRLERIGCKVLANFGQLDPLKGFSDKDSAIALQNDAKKNNYPIQVKIWPGVSHAFCNQDSPYFSETTRNQAFKLVREFITRQ